MKIKLARFLSIFLSGFLLMLTISIFNDWTYEREMLVNLRKHIYHQCKKKDIITIVDTALYYTHKLQDPATAIYGGKKFNTLKQYLSPSSFRNYYFGKDACGAYASFFSRLLASAGYHTKIVQINVNNRKGGHMAVVINYKDKQLLVDPYMNHVFKKPDGSIADINEVARDWYSYYGLHLSPGYKTYYNYQYGWTFTNWDKYGAVSRAAYHVLSFVLGKKKVDNFAYHSYIMGFNKFYIITSFIGFVLMFSLAIRLNYSHTIKQYFRFLASEVKRKKTFKAIL